MSYHKKFARILCNYNTGFEICKNLSELYLTVDAEFISSVKIIFLIKSKI